MSPQPLRIRGKHSTEVTEIKQALGKNKRRAMIETICKLVRAAIQLAVLSEIMRG